MIECYKDFLNLCCTRYTWPLNGSVGRVHNHSKQNHSELEIAEVYVLDVDKLGSAEIGILNNLLSDQEGLRASRFIIDKDRDCYVAARGALRCFIGIKIGLPPDKIVFGQTGNQKPSIAHSLEFNISKSGHLVAIAFSDNCSIGVDIECIRPISDMRELLASCLSEREKVFLKDPTERDALCAWTLKEAALKASGEGLYRDPRSIEFSGFPPAAVHLRSIDGSYPDDEWHAATFEPHQGYIAAIVARRIKNKNILLSGRA